STYYPIDHWLSAFPPAYRYFDPSDQSLRHIRPFCEPILPYYLLLPRRVYLQVLGSKQIAHRLHPVFSSFGTDVHGLHPNPLYTSRGTSLHPTRGHVKGNEGLYRQDIGKMGRLVDGFYGHLNIEGQSR